MSAPYIEVYVVMGLVIVLVALWKMDKLNSVKFTTHILRVFSLSIEVTSESKTRMIDDGDSHHDPQ